MISRFAKSFLAIILALFLVTTVALLHPPSRAAYIDPWTGDLFGEGSVEQDLYHSIPPSQTSAKNAAVDGGVIMSKLSNATAKAELGRATWKLLHTMTLKYPERPTDDEKQAFASYIYLTSRLYPCGDCATEFQALLKTFPPQTSSRRAASQWLCSVHNEVNIRLGKEVFDCAHLDENYDCGCGDEAGSTPATADPMDLEWDPSKDEKTGVELIRGGR